ncbi:hypothetical protein lerEdw1_010853 [Lerista edwardsae]|nr:hypothetical protein lerEdw1_010853 [Lerista edwardsae]
MLISQLSIGQEHSATFSWPFSTSWKHLQSFLMRNRVDGEALEKLQEIPGLALGHPTVDISLSPWQIHFGITGRPKQIAEQQSATKPWPQAGAPQKTHKDRIRQLLCDNPACKVCERVAEEATQFLYSQGADSHVPAGLSPESRTELPVLHGAFFERGHREETVRVAEHAARDWKEGRHWVLDGDSEKEDIFSLSSTTITTSVTTWTESSSGLSEAAACRHLKDFRSKQQKGSRGHSQEAFAETHHRKRVDVTTVLTVQRDIVSRAKVRATRLLAGPRRTRVIHFTPQKILFLEDAEIANLESHLVGKRVHHLLGLPLALSRSLRSFVPPAPSSAPWSHLRDVDVVTRPQVLPFVAVGARRNLELHVKKMVQLKRWQLPWRVQASLRYMKPPPQPREKLPSALQKPRPLVLGHVEHIRKTQKSIVKLLPVAPVLASKAIAGSQGKLQAYFTKRSLERRLEVFPAIVGHSQKMVTETRARKRPLPKLIQVGQRCPQLRSGLCLSLQRKAEVVEMSIKCKCIHYFWGLPTLYMESLAQIAPATPSLPAAPSRVRGFVEFGHAEPPFLALRQRKDLESHVLRKRLQHQWGLPGLVQRSLRGFLTAASPPAHVASVAHTRIDVNVFVGFSPLLFSTLKIKQQPLETHLRRKVVERRWGLPRRVLESLRVFMPAPPSLTKRPGEGEKTFLKGKAEKRTPRGFLGQRQDWKRQALQRHVAKKALEVQLGMAASVVLQSWKTACQAGKRVPSRAIPPWLQPIQSRSQELPFVSEATLGCIQLNIIHKNLTCKWGLPTLYNASLAQLFQHSALPAAYTASGSVGSAAFGFTGRETLFLGRKTRETLESHVKRKRLQHTWGLPGLVQRSLQSFLPAAPTFGWKAGHQEVAVFNTDLSFLSKATKQALERNVQKRVLYQRWQLPRRVLESLKLLHPKFELGGRTVQIAGKEQGARKEAARPPQAQLLSTVRAVVRVNLQRHLAKKSLELRLEAFPTAVRVSWRCTWLLVKRPLPKTIPPGDKHLLPRRALLPFAGQRQMHRIEVAVRRNQLACLWELSVRHVGALRGMGSGLPPRRRRAAVDFTGVRMSLPPGFDREALERHVRRKRLQHEWGFPALIHRSLGVLMHGPPSLAASVQTNIRVCVLLPDVLFLPRNLCSHLEIHLQKMKLHRLWGLPRRVLDALRLLQPELRAGAPGQEPSGGARRVGRESPFVSSVKGRTAACVPCVFGATRKGSRSLAKIQLHWAKKRMEMQFEAFPAVVLRSWRWTLLLTPRQPLPRLVPSGCKPLQVRKVFLPFVPQERADRLELTVRLCHLSSLWGLGVRYVETLQAVLPPRPVSQPPGGQRAALCLSRGPARVQGQNQEMLELHVRKKRLQHQWGFPLLVQRSLEAFMQDTALDPGLHRTAPPIRIRQQDLPFLPESTSSHLEHHVQRQKLQRKWGLPRRVLDSLKLLFSGVPRERMEPLSVRSFSRDPWPMGATQAEEDQRKGPGTPGAAPRQPRPRLVPRTDAAEKLQQHLAKKSLEVHFEAFPAVLRASERRLPQSQPLPKPVRPDLQAPKPRHSPFSVGREGMNQIEHALQRHHFASLWGLGPRYVDAVAGMAPRLPSPLVRFRETPYDFSEARTPFFRQRGRETLEQHIGKKRMQHTWGVPVLVQRSLHSFLQDAPCPLQKGSEPSRSVVDIYVLHQELPFLPRDTCRRLEHHIQRTKLQRKWGLPGKVQESLKVFLPSASSGTALFPPSDKKSAQAGSSRVHARQLETPSIAPENIHALESRLPRTHLQTGLEAHPGLLSQPQAGQSGREGKHLPRPVHKGQKQPISRPPSLPLLRPRTVDNLDMNVKHKYLTFLWGQPYKDLGPLATVDHASRSPVRIGQVRSRSQRLQSPLLLQEAREMLDCHIQKKRLHHFWGLPAAIQRSLLAFAPPAATSVSPPHRVARKIKIQVEHLPFVSESVQQDLETSLKKMIIHGRWGLPKKMHKFLRGLTPNALVARDLPGSMRRGASSYGRDTKKYMVRMSEVTYVEAPSKEVYSGVPVTFFPVAEFLKQSNILDSHLKKKSLEIKFQLIPAVVHHKAFAGSIKQIRLPKCPLGSSVVKPRRAFPRFVEEKSLGKIQENIRRKYLAYLWGLPSLHTESLRKLFGKVPEPLKPRYVVFHIGDTLDSPRLGREATGEAVHHGRLTATSVVSGESIYTPPTLGPPLLTDEALDLLESHIRNKKLQHQWGLPTIVQKSLRKFAPTYSEMQSPSMKRGLAATRSQGAREARVAAQRLSSFGPARTERLEADMTYYTAAHRRHLPRRIQESLKTPPPPESLLQAEGSKWEAQTLLCRCDQTLQAAPEQAPREAEDLPRNRLHQASHSAERLPGEASSLLDFHIRQKRNQHAWGLPVTVQKSLRAFARPPPKPSPGSPKARAAALVTERGKRSVTVQTPSVPLHSEPPEKQKSISLPKGQVATDVSKVPALLPPEQEPTLFPREIQDLLEFHIQHKKIQHAWGLPSTVLRSLKFFAPFPRGPEKHTPAAEKATTAQMLPWAREDVSITTRSLLFLSSDTKEHLESHMRSIIAEHRWQLPRRVKKPLKAFRSAVSPPAESGPPTQPWLPPDSESLRDSPTEPQLETESSVRTFQATREVSAERAELEQPSPTSPISAGTRSAERAAGLPFLTLAAERELELHIQRKKIQHEWGLPKAIQRSLQAFAPLPPDPPQRLQSAQGGSLAAGRPQNLLAGRRSGAQEPWGVQEVKAQCSVLSAQELHCLDQGTTDALEAHVQTLIAEHKWRLSGLLQKSVKPFVLAASRPPAGGPEEQGVLSTYYHDMTMSVAGIPPQTEAEEEAPSGPEEFHRYRSELFYHIEPDGGPASWQAAENCPLCPAAEPQHFLETTGIGGSWEAGRAASGTGSLQKITLQESSLHVHVEEVTNGQCSRVSAETWESGLPPVSPREPLPRKYVSRTSCWTETRPSSQRAASPSGRVRGRDPAPRASKGVSWQPECGIQRTASSSQSPPRTCPRQGSTSSLCSDTGQRWWQQEEEDPGEAAKAEDDESQSVSSSSSGASVEDAPLPEQEADAWVAPVTWTGSSSSTELCRALESQSSYEDMVATHYRQAERGHQGQGSRRQRRRGSLLGWCKCSRESLLCQAPRDGAAANISVETTFQGDPAHGCQPQTGRADGGGAQLPQSPGGVSQFSTECEWEEVGDWDGEEAAAGESPRLGEEEGGRAKAAGGEVVPRCVDSPAAELPQASRDAALIRESRAILRDKMLRLAAGQAMAEPFPSQSSISETESRTETHLLPEQPPGALQNVVLTEEVHSSTEIKHSEIWLCSEGEASLAVAAAATTEPGARMDPSARKEALSWGREAPPKEPSAGQKPLVERKEVELVHAQSSLWKAPEGAQEPQFVGGDSCDEKCSIIGSILEKKMYLQQGLHVWVQSNERLAVARKESGKGMSAGHTK